MSIRIGHIDLGSTHPEKFIAEERRLGYSPVAVYSDVPAISVNEVKDFAQKLSLQYCSTLEQLMQKCDIAVIHSVNWDRHLPLAQKCVQGGLGVFIDKPICGNLPDIRDIERLQQQGGRLSGGSMVLYHDELSQLKKEETATNALLYAAGPLDRFYYGIHIYYMLCGAAGFDISWVRYIDENVHELYEVGWENGNRAVMAIGGSDRYFPFHLTILSKNGWETHTIRAFLSLAQMLASVLPYLAGNGTCEFPIEKCLRCERAALAGEQSRKEGGKKVYLGDVREDIMFDGKAFEERYFKIKHD